MTGLAGLKAILQAVPHAARLRRAEPKTVNIILTFLLAEFPWWTPGAAEQSAPPVKPGGFRFGDLARLSEYGKSPE
jgi:hypothetical protein